MAKSTVTIENLGRSFECGDQYVLDAALNAGVAIPYNCRGGACGTCKAQVLEGRVEHGWVMGFAISDREVAEGKCLVCSSKPATAHLRLRMLNELPAASTTALVPEEYETDIVGLSDLSETVRLLTVRLPDSHKMTFEAGMYMEVVLPGMDPPRPYSILTVPGSDGAPPEGLISFLVGRHEHGKCSQHLRTRVRIGDKLLVRGPYGQFTLLPPVVGKIVMLAGGTGLAPIVSIAERLLRDGCNERMELFFSVRRREDVFFIDALSRLASRHSNFRYKVHVTREGAAPMGWYCGRVTRSPELPSALAGASRVLVAGSPEFVDACVQQAVGLGVPPEAVTVEAYVSKSV